MLKGRNGFVWMGCKKKMKHLMLSSDASFCECSEHRFYGRFDGVKVGNIIRGGLFKLEGIINDETNMHDTNYYNIILIGKKIIPLFSRSFAFPPLLPRWSNLCLSSASISCLFAESQ